ncbi:MAG: exodeoxyribonuclease VII large subunit, partial [Halothiobacillaceae bacterium]
MFTPSSPLTVSSLVRKIKTLLEGNFPLVLVEGEISNLARPGSGHLYFTLKDANAQLRCAMFHNRASLLRFCPKDGVHVLVRARITMYEPRGDLQLVVEHMEEAGLGALQRAFEQLKQRLAAEGLFDAARKRQLPTLPHRIGIITSPSGAAVRDVLHVLQRRFPMIPLRIYPTSVQGAGAADEIVAALRRANEDGDCDVLLLVRGGGSLEDLWPFNEERVARAIAASRLPVISGVGHETDFTIADFVADARAPTPSAAASLAVPDALAVADQLRALEARLLRRMQDGLDRRAQRLDSISRHLFALHPRQRLE